MTEERNDFDAALEFFINRAFGRDRITCNDILDDDKFRTVKTSLLLASRLESPISEAMYAAAADEVDDNEIFRAMLAVARREAEEA